MEESKDKNKVCKYCGKKFLSGRSLGGHIRIHMNNNSVNEKKRSLYVSPRLQEQRFCRECGTWFVSSKSHICQSDTEKVVMKQSDYESLSESEIDAALGLMMLSRDPTFNQVAVDEQLKSGDVILSDSDSSDSDYYINSPEKSESDISLTSFTPKFNKSKRKRTKDHECPICLRVFRSVRALSGHKSLHSIKGQGQRNQQQTSQMPNPFDLNLPSLDTDE